MAKAVAFAWLSAVPRQIAIASGTSTRPMTPRRIVQPGEVLSSSGMVSSASSGSAQYQSGEVSMPSAALQTVTAMLNVATVIGMSSGGPHEVAPGAGIGDDGLRGLPHAVALPGALWSGDRLAQDVGGAGALDGGEARGRRRA